MRQISYIVTLLFCLVSCQGKAENKQSYVMVNAYPTDTMPDIRPNNLNTQNYVDTLSQLIRHYEQEPYYYLNFNSAMCGVEILVNDIPVYRCFRYINDGGQYSFNDAILEDGIQKLTYRLYPVGKTQKYGIFDTLT